MRVGEGDRAVDARLDARELVVDVALVDLLGRVDGRELELLLRPEVRVQAALAHADLVGEARDREVADALHRRQPRRRLEDVAPGPLPVAARALERLHGHTSFVSSDLPPTVHAELSTVVRTLATANLARPVVLTTTGPQETLHIMLASNPIEFRHDLPLPLPPVGRRPQPRPAHGRGWRSATRSRVLGAAALLVVGYVIGGVATSGTVASTGDAPLPVDIGGGAAKVKPATVVPADVRGRPSRSSASSASAPATTRPRCRPRDDPGARGRRVPPRPGQSAADRRRRPVTAPASGAG